MEEIEVVVVGWGQEKKGNEKVDNVKYFLISTCWLGTCMDFCIWKISGFDKVG